MLEVERAGDRVGNKPGCSAGSYDLQTSWSHKGKPSEAGGVQGGTLLLLSLNVCVRLRARAAWPEPRQHYSLFALKF